MAGQADAKEWSWETARLTWRELPRCGDQRDAEFERKRSQERALVFLPQDAACCQLEMCGLRPHAPAPHCHWLRGQCCNLITGLLKLC